MIFPMNKDAKGWGLEVWRGDELRRWSVHLHWTWRGRKWWGLWFLPW